MNGTVNVTGNWIDQMVISFEITDFAIGNYSLTIEVEDGENSAVIDNVFLSIITNAPSATDSTGSTEPVDPDDNPLVLILGGGGGLLAVVGGGLFIRRKKLGKSKK